MFSAVHCNTLIEVATNGCEDTIRCSPGDVLSFKLLAHAYHAHPVKGLQGGCSIRCLASGQSCPGGYAVGEERRSCNRGQIAFASSGAAVRRQRAFAGPQIRRDLASCLLQNPAFPFPSRVRMCGLDCIRLRGSCAWSRRGLARPGGLFCFVLRWAAGAMQPARVSQKVARAFSSSSRIRARVLTFASSNGRRAGHGRCARHGGLARALQHHRLGRYDGAIPSAPRRRRPASILSSHKTHSCTRARGGVVSSNRGSASPRCRARRLDARTRRASGRSARGQSPL